MLAVISPSKTLKEEKINFEINKTNPKFEKEANYLIRELKKFTITELMNLMKISEDLAELNFIRYKNFKKSEKYPCGFLFKGDVYRGLDVTNLNKDEFSYLNDHVAILSGLYGYLSFTDEIHPYRLEMGIPLKNKNGNNLYDFWDLKVYRALIKERKPKVIVNLASKEYSKVLHLNKSKIPVVEIEFLQKRKGKLQQIALFSKVARGKMARFIAVTKAKEIDDLKKFDYDDYSFSKELSSESKLVFVR